MNVADAGEPERIMLAWTALEVLSPQSFLRPEDLASGEAARITRFTDCHLPWERGGERSRPNHRLYYQVVLGTIQMEPAVRELLTTYTDSRDERPPARGENILATIIVDREGRPVETDAVAVSSFAWGLPIALKGDLLGLGQWRAAEARIVESLDRQIRKFDEDDRPRPLTMDDISGAYRGLVDELGVPVEMTNPPAFAVKSFQWFKIDEPPEALLLNSFYLGDLDRAHSLFKTNNATSTLKCYVGMMRPTDRRDLMRDDDALAQALHPSKMPTARWPAKGRHPLVALQQAAVNLASHDLRENGILAVNGPPGTGKTTLLRDIVAHVVTERARVMATFEDPEAAFQNTNLRVKKGNAFLWMYKLDQRLRGFEIVVASSNNKAVENVSAELPAMGAVAEDAFPDGYFKTVSDGLLERDTWGLAAAVLGNGLNRSRFRQQFWWNDDTGLTRYLQHAAGTPSKISVEDASGNKAERVPLVVENENPPSDKAQALRRWRAARKRFLEAEKKAKQVLKEAARAADLPRIITQSESERAEAQQKEPAAIARVQGLRGEVALRLDELDAAIREQENADVVLRELPSARPGLRHRLFSTARYRDWRNRLTVATTRGREAWGQRQERQRLYNVDQSRLETEERTLLSIRSTIALATERVSSQKAELQSLRAALGGTFIDDHYFELSHAGRQLASPWLDRTASRTRDEVFEAAMALHKAFVDAAARPLRHNLGLLMDTFGVRSFGSDDKDAVIPHLWSSLFLVVPVVSTTFASVGRMFCRLEPGTLGWLLIDEAGQAVPQAAVGAIMRSQRAVVVGDPLQIEPVVVLPEQLTEAICREFKIDEARFNAPAASAQTLADAATPYFSSFETKTGARDAGVPLLVHRRCADPMFSVSNSIAYENLMVQAKAAKDSPIARTLGPSGWRHIESTGQDKWSAEEGEAVIDLLARLKDAGVEPNLYIVTPFVVVQDKLREHIRSSGLLNNWVSNPGRWPYDRVGTVHTVQGREAEAVIMVLGAPLARQTGARNWAGGRPNLLNVAVSRAQEVLYVIGNRTLWERAGMFAELSSRVPPLDQPV